MLNDTLEEQQRVIICKQQKEINHLRQNILQLQKMVAEESEQKYRAYVKYADLQKELHIQSKNSS
tara:strand:- start:456 stop:650 length:195 start_codon:yes stop_codon:yes gene_type:complete